MPPYNTGKSVQVSLPSTVDMYLRQWLKVASGDRVVLYQYTRGLSHSFAVFKCKTCGDNWHTSEENFEGTQIPQTSKDWVTKHRHVCNEWRCWGAPEHKDGLCRACKWPYGEHEGSWMGETPSMNQIKAKIISEVTKALYPIPEPKNKSLPEFTGRKFRDVEKTDL